MDAKKTSITKFTLEGNWAKEDYMLINPFGGYRESGDPHQPKRIPYNERKWLTKHQEEPKRRASSPTRTARNYSSRTTNEDAAEKAIKFVLALGYNLSARRTREERAHWREGWHLFCVAVQVLHVNYTPTGIRNGLGNFDSAPSRETLSCMFEACRTESKYSHAQVRKMLG